MTTSVLKVTSNERVDLDDFLFAVDESLRAQSRQHFEQFFADPARPVRSWIVSGFEATGTGTANVTVTRGRAIFAQREVGQVFYGAFTTEGELSRIVDISGFANGTYGVYLRFDLIDGESLSRAFWNPAGLGSEIAQTTATRRLANWSVRVELTSPGADWTKVADAVIAGGLISSFTDRRNFFFEGEVDQAYRSSWSTDGGGGANDRNATRKTYGAHDLHTFLAAVRQCLEDVKGRGLRRWWDRDIGGMNIGFDAAPVEDRIAIGDTNFNLKLSGGNPYFHTDEIAVDGFYYHRGANIFQWFIGGYGSTIFSVDASLASFYGDANVRSGGLAVGYSATAAQINDDEITLGDSDFAMSYNLTAPTIYFDRTDVDRLYYDRTGDAFKFIIATNPVVDLVTTGLRSYYGAVIGHNGTPIDDTLSVVDANYFLGFAGGSPAIYFDANDFIRFGRSDNTNGAWKHTINSVTRLRIKGDDAPFIHQYDGTRYQALDSVIESDPVQENMQKSSGGGYPASWGYYAAGGVIKANTVAVGTVIHARLRMAADQAGGYIAQFAIVLGSRSTAMIGSNLALYRHTVQGSGGAYQTSIFIDVVGIVRDATAAGVVVCTAMAWSLDAGGIAPAPYYLQYPGFFTLTGVDFTVDQEVFPVVFWENATNWDIRLESFLVEIQ